MGHYEGWAQFAHNLTISLPVMGPAVESCRTVPRLVHMHELLHHLPRPSLQRDRIHTIKLFGLSASQC